MRVAIIGRTEVLFETARRVKAAGHDIPLIITARETPDYKVTAEDFRKLAQEYGAEYIFTQRINLPEVISKIKALGKIDIGISVNYSGVIAQQVIDLFPMGLLNAHAGDLPRYRGNACPAWAILNGEEKIGLCIHKMIGGELDSGLILAREFYYPKINTRIQEVYDWIFARVPDMFLQAVNELSKNSDYFLEKQSTDPEDALRCYPRIPEDGKITWTHSNLDVLRLINVSSEPYIGSFAFYNDQKITIWRAELVQEKENYLAVPGQVAKINTDGSVEVICGQGKIRITEASVENRRGNPSEFIKSIRQRLT